MDYKKEYVNVLMRAEEAVQKDCLDRNTFDAIFSRLTESEDEKVRKALLEMVSDIAGGWPFEKHRITKKEAIAYLERQKERGPLTKEEERTLHDIILHLEDEGCPTKWKDLLHNIYNLPYTKQEEQEHPNGCFTCDEYKKGYEAGRLNGLTAGYNKAMKEQKPTEWSEEDKRAIDRACVALRAYTNGDLPEFLPSELIGYADRLQSLRPQPRKEIYLGAKHDLAIKFMNYLDENRPEGKMALSNGECEDIDTAFKENDWAKIMRYIKKYSSHWKPSEEQMKAFRGYIKDFQEKAEAAVGGWNNFDVMIRLYEQLKKL